MIETLCILVIYLQGLGAGYRGDVAKTKGGYTCQRWDKEWPHFSLFPPNKHNREAYGIGNNNLCRNPDPRYLLQTLFKT